MTPEYILRASLCRPAYCSDASVEWRASEIDNMQLAREYAERGYDAPIKGILFANWNYFPRGIDSILERYGFAIEWSDEWAFCDNCYRAVRTSPDSMWWEPSFTMPDDCTIVCNHCRALEILRSAKYSLDESEDAGAIELLNERIEQFKAR